MSQYAVRMFVWDWWFASADLTLKCEAVSAIRLVFFMQDAHKIQFARCNRNFLPNSARALC